MQSLSAVFFADSGVAAVTPTSPRHIFSAAFLRSAAARPSTAVEHRPARPARVAVAIDVCDSTLTLQSSTTAAFERLLGLIGVAATLVVETETVVAAALALATASAGETVVVTVFDVELLDEEPQPVSPPAASRAAVSHMEGVRRNVAPLL